MRTLKFIVEGQNIRQDPNCDFSGLIPGASGYLQAEFTFSPEWNGYVKVASFHSMMGREYTPQWIKDGKTCAIPAEALERVAFKLNIIGGKGPDRLTTNQITITQNGGRK